MLYRSLNPATEELLGEYPECSWEETKQKEEKAQAAFQNWKRLSFKKRSEHFQKLATLLRNKKESLADGITTEMGKITREAQGEIEKCAWVCDTFAEQAEKWLQEERVPTEAKQSYVRYDPLGVILGIMPWNFPYWQLFRFAAPTMMAGNCVLLKHAPNVPGCALAIEKLFQESGFPDGVFQNLFINNEVCAKLIALDQIVGVSLTGSTRAGREVAKLAGQNLKKCVLELGGSDPFIVLEDADLEKVIPVAMQSRMMNAGQSCIAAKRFILHQKIAKSFEEKFLRMGRNLKVGDPKHPGTDIGPLARKDLFENLARQVEGAKKEGAKILMGGNRCGGKGFYYVPTILTEVTGTMLTNQEEIFGPVASLMTVSNETEAIRLANQTAYGLGASLWTEDLSKAKTLAKEIEAGAVFINGMVKSDPRLPFGGIKQSGFGRELGPHGLKEFTNIKAVAIN